MRIISGHHDYYDTALGHGADPLLTYVRREEDLGRVLSKGKRAEKDHWQGVYVWHGLPEGADVTGVHFYHRTPSGSLGCHLEVSPVYVAFCGAWRIMWAVQAMDRSLNASALWYSPTRVLKLDWCESVASVEALLRSDAYAFTWSGPGQKATEADRQIAKLAKIEAAVEGKNAEPFQQQHRGAVITVWPPLLRPIADKFAKDHAGFATQVPATAEFPQQVFRDTPLSLIQFAKKVDPYTAFQELSMFLGGVLGVNARPMAAITDRDQVAKKGFDAKYGFRTRPHAKG